MTVAHVSATLLYPENPLLRPFLASPLACATRAPDLITVVPACCLTLIQFNKSGSIFCIPPKKNYFELATSPRPFGLTCCATGLG